MKEKRENSEKTFLMMSKKRDQGTGEVAIKASLTGLKGKKDPGKDILFFEKTERVKEKKKKRKMAKKKKHRKS